MFSVRELSDWAAQSEHLAGRRSLAAAHVPARLCVSLPGYSPEHCSRPDVETELTLSLRTLRNVCAGVAAAQDQLHEARAGLHLAALCERLAQSECSQRAALLALALQVVGNACVLHPQNQEDVWFAARCASFAPTNGCTSQARLLSSCF